VPRVRIEWVPVQTYGLGRLGFDHLQLTFEPSEGGLAPQDDWFVMEGVRDHTSAGTFLGIEGADGRTTLATANLAARNDLTSKIGLPDHRGSRPLPYGDEFGAWETMSSYARDIEAEDYPYIAFGLPNSPTPTINSSSAIASLIHYSGLDPTQQLPYGMHLSPGLATLLGTGADDRMRIEHGFTTLLGGRGADWLEGSAERRQTEKFYGGEGDDVFRWSPGFNIMHGGQPQLDYTADGTDVIDYSGAGKVTITFNPHWLAHRTPNFVAVSEHGVDHLFSVERIQWNAKTDRILLGDGIDLLEDDRVLQPSSSLPAAHTRVAWLVKSSPPPVTGQMAPADAFLGGGSDVIANIAADADVEALLLSGGIVPADVAMFRTAAGDLVLTLGGGEIGVTLFFAAPGGGINQVAFDSDGDFAAPWLWPAADHALPALPSDWHIEAYAAAPF
jgi:Ca2+-binding RTX toxin-like protein